MIYSEYDEKELLAAEHMRRRSYRDPSDIHIDIRGML